MTTHKTPLIAHIIFRLDVGGLENGLVNLINELPTNRFRHAIICIDRATDFRKRIVRDDVEIVEILKRPGRDLGATWRIFQTIKRLKPDILHTRNLGAMDALLPAFFAGVRCRIHGEHGWDVHDVSGASRKHQLLRRLYRPLITHYVALSRDIERYLLTKVGVQSHRLTRITNGVDVNRFIPAQKDSAVRKNLGVNIPDGALVFGTVGRLSKIKNHLLLVDAFIRFVSNAPALASNARLFIVGDGDQRSTIVDRLRDAGILDMCWIPGARNDVQSVLQAIDVFVLPSAAEGISNTILEAMSCGLPVIATDVGGNAELVLNGETGTILSKNEVSPLATAIEAYAKDPILRESHGKCGRLRARQLFSIQSMIDKYASLYQSML